jgi:DNA helicase-2/ATP-dependent DNA helicase PcrA
VERQRLQPASWSKYGATGIAPRADQPSLSTGDSVLHGTLGEGVVTVRFANDGSERRLVLDYAPLQRI